MRVPSQRPIILNLVFSPFGLSLVSACIFFAAVVFPPRLYSRLIGEPDLIFADPATISYFVLCLCGFWAGLLLLDFLFPAKQLLASPPRSESWNTFLLLCPLLATTLASCVEFIVIARSSPNLIALLLADQGNAVKDEAQNVQLGPLAVIDFLHVAVLWWTFAKTRVTPLSRTGRFFASAVMVAAFLAKVAVCILRASRADIMPVSEGLVVLYLLIGIQQGKVTVRKLLTAGAGFVALLLVGFVVAGLLRTGGDPAQAGAEFLGYTLASYNRMAALVHGVMRYPYGGHGVYLSNYLAYDRRINILLPLRKTLNWPEFLELWGSEFQAPQLAGLNANLIWSGAFGYLFADFGWATPLVLVGYGILYGVVWRLFKKGTTAGQVLYPWFAYCALSWFSLNLLLDNALFVMVVTATILALYQRVLRMVQPGLA